MSFYRPKLLPLLASHLLAFAAFAGCARKASMEGVGIGGTPAPESSDPGKKGNADQSQSLRHQAAFLSWNDFEAHDRTKLKNPTQEAMIRGISGDPIFYRNFPSAAGSVASEGSNIAETSCEKDRLEKGFKTEVKGDTITLIYNLNRICEPEYDAESEFRKVHMIQCIGVDLSSLNDKSERELSNILKSILYKGGLCEKASEVREFYNYRKAYATFDDTSYQSSSSDNVPFDAAYPSSSSAPLPSPSPSVRVLDRNVNIRAMMSSEGGPCIAKRKDDNWVYEKECWMKDFWENSSGPLTTLAKLPVVFICFGSAKLKDIVLPIDSKDIWIKSGSAQLEFPFWTGTLTFANGAAPRVVLKSSQGQTVDQVVPAYSPVNQSAPSPNTQDADDSFLNQIRADIERLKQQESSK